MKTRHWYYLVVFGLLLNLLHVGIASGFTEVWSNQYGRLEATYTRASFLRHEYLLNVTFNYSAEIDVCLRFDHKLNFQHTHLYRQVTLNESFQNVDENGTWDGTYSWWNRTEWIEISKNNFNYVVHNGKHYHYLQGWNVNAFQKYVFKLVLTISFENGAYRNGSRVFGGKFDLLCKRTSDSIEDAFIPPITVPSVILDPSWWDGSWTYAKRCNLSSHVRADDTVLIRVAKSSGGDVHTEGNCNDDFSDIRFLNSDNSTELYHWISNYSSGGEAKIFVNITSGVASDGYLYMYYGNAGASDSSDGDNTFGVYCNFEDSVDGWTIYNGGTVTGISQNPRSGSKSLKIEDDSAAASEGGQRAVRIKDRHSVLYHFYDDTADRISHRSYDGVAYGQLDLKHTNNSYFTYSSGSPLWNTTSDTRNNEYFTVEVKHNLSLDRVKVYLNETLLSSHAMYGSPAGSALTTMYSITGSTSNTNTWWIDDFIIRKCHYTDDSDWTGFAQEGTQINNDPVNSDESPTNGGTGVSFHPKLMVKVSDADNEWMNTTISIQTKDEGFITLGTNITKDSGWINHTTDHIGIDYYDTVFYWNVNTSDENGGWDNDSFSFTLRNFQPDFDWLFPEEGYTNATNFVLCSVDYPVSDGGVKVNGSRTLYNLTFAYRTMGISGWNSYANWLAGVYRTNNSNRPIGQRSGLIYSGRITSPSSMYGMRCLVNTGSGTTKYYYVNFTISDRIDGLLGETSGGGSTGGGGSGDGSRGIAVGGIAFGGLAICVALLNRRRKNGG